MRTDPSARMWETFPWRESEYPGPSALSFEERILAYAQAYWRLRLAAERTNETSPAVVEVAPQRRSPRSLWPPRDPGLGPNQLDLTEHYTGLLTCMFHPATFDCYHDDTLASVPRGSATFGEVLFDVRGVVVLRKTEQRWAFVQHIWRRYPSAVEGIQVGQHFRRLHVLHGALRRSAGAPVGMVDPRQADPPRDGLRLGSYRLHYDDGTRHEFEIVYGQDVRDWWSRPDLIEGDTPSARLIWSGTNASSALCGSKLRLYLRTYENPHPNRRVSHVDFVSDVTLAAPFLVAMTVE